MRMVCALQHVVVSTDARSTVGASFVFIHLFDLALVQIDLDVDTKGTRPRPQHSHGPVLTNCCCDWISWDNKCGWAFWRLTGVQAADVWKPFFSANLIWKYCVYPPAYFDVLGRLSSSSRNVCRRSWCPTCCCLKSVCRRRAESMDVEDFPPPPPESKVNKAFSVTHMNVNNNTISKYGGKTGRRVGRLAQLARALC